MDASNSNEADTNIGDSAKNLLPKNTGRTINIKNDSDKNPTIIIDPYHGELISCNDGEVDFSFDDFEMSFAGQPPDLIRLQSFNSRTFMGELDKIRELLESKTDEKFEDLNERITVILKYVVDNNTQGKGTNFPSIMRFIKRDDEKSVRVLSPNTYYSANQFQADVIDMMNIKELKISECLIEFVMPVYCNFKITLFTT